MDAGGTCDMIADQNSQLSFMLDLYSNMIRDLQQRYPSFTKSFLKDIETLRLRCLHEGLSFLTKTLPKLGKAIDLSLETGKLVRPREFKLYGHTEIPAFLSGILLSLYHDDGTLRSGPVGGFIRDLRQFLFGVRNAEQHVFVYGDDLIVPTEHAHAVMERLESVGLLVNRSKSFVNGFFRESCGVDAWRGIIVTPTRIKHIPSRDLRSGHVMASLAAFANHMDSKGWIETATCCRRYWVQTYGKLPYGTAESGYPCHAVHSKFVALIKNLEHGFIPRWNSHLQRVEMKLLVIRPQKTFQPFDGWNRCLSSCYRNILSNPETVVFPRHTQIRQQWVEII